jgi:hypothetical protein
MNYIPLRQAVEQLGKGYSRRTILRRIDTGEWLEGVHWIDDRRTGSSRRLIKINLEAVEKWRKTPVAKR